MRCRSFWSEPGAVATGFHFICKSDGTPSLRLAVLTSQRETGMA